MGTHRGRRHGGSRRVAAGAEAGDSKELPDLSQGQAVTHYSEPDHCPGATRRAAACLSTQRLTGPLVVAPNSPSSVSLCLSRAAPVGERRVDGVTAGQQAQH